MYEVRGVTIFRTFSKKKEKFFLPLTFNLGSRQKNSLFMARLTERGGSAPLALTIAKQMWTV